MNGLSTLRARLAKLEARQPPAIWEMTPAGHWFLANAQDLAA
jgi:hypothetical protein